MQVHISLTHIHFTLPNDCFYIAPFSVRKTQLYVCTNHCNCKACPQYRAWVVGTQYVSCLGPKGILPQQFPVQQSRTPKCLN